MGEFEEELRLIGELGEDGVQSHEETIEKTLSLLEQVDDLDKQRVAGLLDNYAVRRLYQDTDPETADEVLGAVGRARTTLGTDGLLAVLGAIFANVGEGPDLLSDADDIVNAIEGRRKVHEYNSTGNQGGRPSKVDAAMERVRNYHGLSTYDDRLRVAIQETKEEVSRPTWYKFRDRCQEELDLDVSDYLD